MKTTLEKAKRQTNKDNVQDLQAIIRKNYDASQGFRKAMMDAKNPDLKNFLQQQARQRSHFATAIDREIRQLGKIPKEKGSIAATFHRTWIDIKSTLAGNYDEFVLKEVMRGEKAKVKEYKHVIKNNTLAPQIKIILQSQLKEIKNSLKHVKHSKVTFSV